MPTRKQRRRRQKGKRHDYEYVYLDAEGNEVEVDPEEADEALAAHAKPSANGKPTKTPSVVKDARGRTLRNVKPPSWRRAAQRAGMFVVVLDGTVRVEAAAESVDGGAGTLFHFDPDERRSVTSDGGARLLLLLAPWPGEGHYRGERPASSAVSAS